MQSDKIRQMQGEVVQVIAQGQGELKRLLELHPFVSLASFVESDRMLLEFGAHAERRVTIGDARAPLYGLTELMDNNPLVCADFASVTSAAGSLALITLGPLAKAEMLINRPAIAYNFEVSDLDEVDAALATEGWLDGAAIAGMDEYSEILAAEAIAEIPSSVTEGDLADLFDECFGRSFFVRSGKGVGQGDAHAVFSFGVEPYLETTMFKCVAQSSAAGKCGAAGLVHMFNVMSGYEESLGISDTSLKLQ